MNRCPDILFITEYIKNVLYFSTVRNGKVIKDTVDAHYFCIDDELVYENYYSDFGPLNLGCIYRYCKILNEKLKLYLNKQIIIHYTSIDPKKKANAAFLLGCYGVLYLSLSPKDALKPLIVHGQSYRPFQDATQGDSIYTITIMDCLHAIKKARELGFFSFQDFNYDEYERLDKLQGGDLNWIIPGKFLAFIGPVDYSVSLYHPPELYIDYFLENNVKIVIRLNKRLYDGNVFNNVGIVHYDLFFPDGSCPPKHILFKFLQISEDSEDGIAVHCKAGLGRTGSLIGCYLIKHYRMTSHEAIGWMRICRPGSVIGHQQGWLEQLEPWLIKQGNIYRKRMYHDTERLPTHEFGIYSIMEKTMKQKSVVYRKSPSPPPPMQRQARLDLTPVIRPQASRIRDVVDKTATRNTSEGRVKTPKLGVQKIHKGYIQGTQIKSNVFSAVRRGSAQSIPGDFAKDEQETRSNLSRRSSGAGEPRPFRPPSRVFTVTSGTQKSNAPPKDSTAKTVGPYHHESAFRTSQTPMIKNVNDARDFLMRSSIFNKSNSEREKTLNSAVTVTPHHTSRASSYISTTPGNMSHVSSIPFNSVSRGPTQPQQRRRLGRSPSPPQARISNEQSRATNTQSPVEKKQARDSSKSTLKEALSRLKLSAPRNGSIGAASVGAASLGARREAPSPKRAPSVRSDERPLATQGDMLNSIKFQRRLRATLQTNLFQDKVGVSSKEKPSVKDINSKICSSNRHYGQDVGGSRHKPTILSKSFLPANRPSSPKGRRNMQNLFY